MERVERDYMGIGKSVRWVTSWEGRGWAGGGEREGWMKNMYHFVGGLSSLWDGGLGTAGHWRVVGKERERHGIGTVRYEVLNPDDGSNTSTRYVSLMRSRGTAPVQSRARASEPPVAVRVPSLRTAS